MSEEDELNDLLFGTPKSKPKRKAKAKRKARRKPARKIKRLPDPEPVVVNLEPIYERPPLAPTLKKPVSVREMAMATLKEHGIEPSGFNGYTWDPTPETRYRVQQLAAWGLAKEKIALLTINPISNKPLSVRSLEQYFEYELTAGPAAVNANVAEALYNKAIDPDGGAPSVTAAVHWTKTRMGWTDKSTIDVNHNAGVLMVPGSSDSTRWIDEAKAQGDKPKPGSDEFSNP